MINVMYIVNESGLGGAAQSLLDMLADNQEDINPTVIIPSNGIIEERLYRLRISYFVVPFCTDHRPIGSYAITEKDLVFADNYHAALELQKIIRTHKIQIIHTNSSVSNVGAIAALLARIPHIWHIRELLEEHFDYEFVDRELKAELLQCTDKVISISNCVKDRYKQKYNVDSVCIYNGLYAERFLCSDFSLKSENCFLLAGAISLQKGQLETVKAVNEIVKNGVDIHLYIAGLEDTYQFKWILKRYVKKYRLESNVHIYQFRKDLRELRKKCLFSIMASRMEALGRVTIEAMMAGCIVIGADTGGTAEIIGSDGTRGYLYRQGDYKDLARVIQYAMEHREENVRIQKTAQSYAVETFSVGKYMNKLMEVYEVVIQRKENYESCRKAELRKKMEDRYKELKDSKVCTVHLDEQVNIKRRELQKIIQRWMELKLENRSLGKALLHQHVRSVAIYGMGYLGCCLYEEFESSGVKIEYVMDKGLVNVDEVVKVVSLNEDLPEVDAVVVSVLGQTMDLCSLIRSKGIKQILTVYEIMDWCEEM